MKENINIKKVEKDSKDIVEKLTMEMTNAGLSPTAYKGGDNLKQSTVYAIMKTNNAKLTTMIMWAQSLGYKLVLEKV